MGTAGEMPPKLRQPRRRQRLGLVAGTGASLAITVALTLPGQANLRARGPMNPGHAALACGSCHRSAPGTMRQQLQANARYLIGLRTKPVAFGRLPVENSVCLDCHERPNDRHPVFRFREPRFQEAREALAPHRCGSCHREHTGRRLMTSVDFCSECHSELAMKVDPLDVPHATLVDGGRWQTCLGCHDFHGNHVHDEPTRIAQAISPERLLDYFGTGDSPYPGQLHHPARTELPSPAGNAR